MTENAHTTGEGAGTLDEHAPRVLDAEQANAPRSVDDHLAGLSKHGTNDFRIEQLNRMVASMVLGRRVLDFGCGTGALTLHLLETGFDVVSVDVSESLVKLARSLLERHGRSAENVLAVSNELPARDLVSRYGKFDTVTSLDVIEHVEDDVGALRRVRQCLSSNGRLIVSVPALPALYGARDEAMGHYRRYTKQTLHQSLRAGGFETQSIRFWNLLGVGPVWLASRTGKRVPEEFRYANHGLGKRLLNDTLRLWFRVVENHICPPIGVSLIATATPANKQPETGALARVGGDSG